MLSPSPSATKESSTNDVFDCSHLTPFSKCCKPRYGSYLSLHPPSVAASEPTANNKSDASETELAGRFSSLSIVCNAMEVDEDAMDIDLPEIDWMQVDCDEMEVDGP